MRYTLYMKQQEGKPAGHMAGQQNWAQRGRISLYVCKGGSLGS